MDRKQIEFLRELKRRTELLSQPGELEKALRQMASNVPRQIEGSMFGTAPGVFNEAAKLKIPDAVTHMLDSIT